MPSVMPRFRVQPKSWPGLGMGNSYMSCQRQPSRKRLLVHFVNLSGHADTAYFAPIEMHHISVELADPFRRATATRLDQELPITTLGQQRRFVLPRLEAYEVVVLDE